LYLDFKRATLLNVLTILSELSQINFVAGTEVANREINMMLDGVTFEDALEAIAQGSNVVYEYIPDRNVYLFRTAADKADMPLLMTKVFKLYYVRVTKIREIEGEGGSSGSGTTGGTTFTALTETQNQGEEESSAILKIVESMLSERGKVEIDDRSNSLVVTDQEDRIRLVEQAIAQLDRRIDQVLINTILVETFEDLDKFLGIEWSTTGTEGTLWSMTPAGARDTSFPYNFFKSFKALPKTDGIYDDVPPLADDTITAGTTTWANMTVTLKALQDASKLKIIAKPRILVLDNHPALIKITTNEAVGSQTNTLGDTTAGITSTSVERTETGTSLRVTPLINMENRITMTVEPRFVTSAAAASGAPNTRDPTIRTARTTLMVNDGQTIVLGGLLDSRQTNSVRKMPILGDVPWFGEIFTRRTTDTKDRELVLFLTPSIVRDPSEVQAFSVPDSRDRFDDLTAPFWKVKQKDWYRKLKEEAAAENKETEVLIDISARQKLIEDTLVELAHKQKQASG
jgi:type IV pilus secretin PilQ/predicted competence protein